MGYELEFIGVSEETKDADALCMRWDNGDGKYTVGIYDSGFQIHGETMKKHVKKYYFDSKEGGVIDFIICSHSDQDHVCGIGEILNNFEVKALYMNRPWLHIDNLFEKVNDGRITKDSLEKRLKEKYKYIADLEEIAIEKNVEIFDLFQGNLINERLEVLSPTKDFYLDLLVESDKTPLSEATSLTEKIAKTFSQLLNALIESWSDEKLREDVKTTAENEMSAVVLGKMESEKYLLTGDVGLRGLKKAIEYADTIGISLKDNISVYQMPHHGGRHNVSPTILNNLLGEILDEGIVTNKKAFVCVGKNSDHPKKMVVNAFIRRGVRVFKASGSTVRHSVEMPAREGWSAVANLNFSDKVEEWD